MKVKWKCERFFVRFSVPIFLGSRNTDKRIDVTTQTIRTYVRTYVRNTNLFRQTKDDVLGGSRVAPSFTHVSPTTYTFRREGRCLCKICVSGVPCSPPPLPKRLGVERETAANRRPPEVNYFLTSFTMRFVLRLLQEE